VQFLEAELSRYRAAEQMKKKESDKALQRMQARLRAEELSILRGEKDFDEENGMRDEVYDSGRDNSDSSADGYERKKRREGAGAARGRGGGGGGGGGRKRYSDSGSESDLSDDSIGHSDLTSGSDSELSRSRSRLRGGDDSLSASDDGGF
jgi:hypothetical protein